MYELLEAVRGCKSIAHGLTWASCAMLVTSWLLLPANCKTTNADAESDASKAETLAAKKFRLSAFCTPSEYTITIEPDLKNFTFSGEESIKITLHEPSTVIEMNAMELKIPSAYIAPLDVTEVDEKSKKALDIKFDIATQKVRFASKERLAAGSYQFHCKFNGSITDQLRGFFRARYEDSSHNKRWLATTQMEPTDARRMFPCFDEPSSKAVFKINALIEKNHVAISNSPVAKEEMRGQKKLVVFEPTPKMSSYLLALVVGDLKCAGEVKSGNTPIRVWAVAGKEHLGKYALEEAAKILDYQTKYFGIPYLGKKLDLIALPEFSSGAMENIGAITYLDSNLLLDAKTGSSFQRQDIFGTTAHELAHQWFGDLVTMSWWDDLWLNEAFATWMASKAEHAIHPEWQTLTETVYSRIGSMSTDSLKATRAIHATVVNPSQAVEMFDGITYSKGASVLHMLEAFVGEEAFQHGIQKYLLQHQFGNASAADFWNAIAAESTGVPVAEIMRKFVYQAGYPQVNVKVTPDGKQITCSQYRQLRLGQDKKDPSLWFVPLVLRELRDTPPEKPTENDTITRLLTKREESFELNSSGTNPLLVNAGARGYYRTCYEPKHLQVIQKSFDKLSAAEKIMLLSDCSSLVLPGDIQIEDYFNFVHLLNKESDPMVLTDLVELIDGPEKFMMDASRKNYQRWVRFNLIPLKAKLGGWNQKPNDSQQTKSLRAEVLDLLGRNGQDKATISEAFSLYNKYLKDHNVVNPDLISTVFNIVAYNGGTKEYEQIIQLWKSAKNPADEERALETLVVFRQPDLVRRTQLLAMSKEVKLRQGLEMLIGLAFNIDTRSAAWAYIKQNWSAIMHHFPEEELSSLASLANAFDTPDREQEFRAWYATRAIPYAKSRVARSLESMHTRVLYRQRYGQRLKNWVMAEAARTP